MVDLGYLSLFLGDELATTLVYAMDEPKWSEILAFSSIYV
jgi:hypothetical protein